MTDASLSALFAADHRACDALLPAFETAVQNRQWPAAAAASDAFERAMRRHLDAEELRLFPAFEKACGQRGGPTMVMRMEHDQMRLTMTALRDAVQRQDQGRCLDLTDSLMVLIQQHNMKEEQVLYPLCEQLLGRDQDLHRDLATALGS